MSEPVVTASVPVDDGLKASLYERYVPHNERLCSLLGEDLGFGPPALAASRER